MTGYVADLSWKNGARAIEKLDRLRSTMAVNVLTYDSCISFSFKQRDGLVQYYGSKVQNMLSQIWHNENIQACIYWMWS